MTKKYINIDNCCNEIAISCNKITDWMTKIEENMEYMEKNIDFSFKIDISIFFLLIFGDYFIMVGKTGFEPATPWSQTKCSTKLSHFPIKNSN